jgi:tetratricopeptide (TPR) repeat protein
MIALSVGQVDEARNHARDALALSRRMEARAGEAQALRLAGEAASAGEGNDAESNYREALVLATELGMRPLVAHCHLGLGKLYRRAGDPAKAQEHLTTATMMYRDMRMALWLAKAEAESLLMKGKIP